MAYGKRARRQYGKLGRINRVRGTTTAASVEVGYTLQYGSFRFLNDEARLEAGTPGKERIHEMHQFDLHGEQTRAGGCVEGCVVHEGGEEVVPGRCCVAIRRVVLNRITSSTNFNNS